MPIDTQHPEYDKYHPIWVKCRRVVEGEEAVKKEGALFLPRLEGQTDADYEAYKNRAMFFAGTTRTVQALLGMAFRKEPKVEWPEGKEDLKAQVINDGRPLETFLRDVTKEMLTVGRYGLLVDFPNVPDPQALPYIAGYETESIINWKTQYVDGRLELTLLVLKEKEPKVEEDEFSHETEDRYRVYRRVPLTVQGSQGQAIIDGWYVVAEVWKKVKGAQVLGQSPKDSWVLMESVEPMIRGERLERIPFFFLGPQDLRPQITPPPIKDLVNVNLSHYRTSADLEHGRHFTALPTAWASGFGTKSLSIGSQTAWVSEEPNARCGFLEFSGAGLGALETGMTEKQQLMAVLGAKLLEEDQKAGVEAADTLRMRKASENSILASVVGNISEGSTNALQLWAFWAGMVNAEIEIEMVKDFSDFIIQPDMLSSLMAAVQQGMISWDTFFFQAEQGELFPEGRTPEEERALIEQGAPMAPPGAVDLMGFGYGVPGGPGGPPLPSNQQAA